MCDTFCVRGRQGTLFAKSSDRPVDEVQLVRWFGRRPPGSEVAATYRSLPDAGAAALLGSQPAWMWGLEHGVNEHGVAIGNEKVWTVDDPRAVPPALLGMDLVRLGLERGTTADEALGAMVQLLEVHGQGGSGEQHHDEPYWSSFLVVDGQGGWVLETSGRSWVAQPVGAGAAISNRLTLSTGWTRSSADVTTGTDWDARRAPDAPTGIADHRLAATRACVARGGDVSPAEAVATLRDHGTGPWGAPGEPAGRTDAPPPPPAEVGDDWSGVTVCMHLRDYQTTTASVVAELPSERGAPIRAWATLGPACTAVFLPVLVRPDQDRPEAVLPDVLGDADAWQAFAALGRGVEAPGAEGAGALTRIREVLDPVEVGAWAEADDLWSAGADLTSWRAASRRWDAAVRAALDTLDTLDSRATSVPR